MQGQSQESKRGLGDMVLEAREEGDKSWHDAMSTMAGMVMALP